MLSSSICDPFRDTSLSRNHICHVDTAFFEPNFKCFRPLNAVVIAVHDHVWNVVKALRSPMPSLQICKDQNLNPCAESCFRNVFACWFYANYLTCPRVLVPPECSRLFDGQGTMDFQSRSCIFVTAQCRQDFATPNQSHCLLLSTFLQTAHMSSVNCQKPKWAHPQQVQAKCEPSFDHFLCPFRSELRS